MHCQARLPVGEIRSCTQWRPDVTDIAALACLMASSSFHLAETSTCPSSRLPTHHLDTTRRRASEHPSAWRAVSLRECPQGGAALRALAAAGRPQHAASLDLVRQVQN